MTRKQALTILGLREGADAEAIKRAYRKLAFALHPDLHPDNPNAGKEFQRLNEAYVLLGSPERAQRSSFHRQSATAARAEATEKARADAERTYARAKKRFEAEQAREKHREPLRKGAAAQPGREKNREMDRDEVLRDLLRDPFARRVFEDIYSMIREDAEKKQAAESRRGAQAQAYVVSGPGFLERTLEKTADNLSDWFRRQIDEDQTVRLAGPLTPGKRVRLQIHHGVFGRSQTIELTLPPEFEPGRPIRLKGLGKRIGKWRGDLYLRIVEQ